MMNSIKSRGILRYLSGWDASWICYYDNSMHIPEISGGERNFKKEIDLDAPVKEAKVAILQQIRVTNCLSMES